VEKKLDWYLSISPGHLGAPMVMLGEFCPCCATEGTLDVLSYLNESQEWVYYRCHHKLCLVGREYPVYKCRKLSDKEYLAYTERRLRIDEYGDNQHSIRVEPFPRPETGEESQIVQRAARQTLYL